MKILVVDTTKKVTTTFLALMPCIPELDLETAGEIHEAETILSQGGVLVVILMYDPLDPLVLKVAGYMREFHCQTPYIIVSDLNREELLKRGGTEALRLLNDATRFLSYSKLEGWAPFFSKALHKEVANLALDKAMVLVRQVSDAFRSGERPATKMLKPFEDHPPLV